MNFFKNFISKPENLFGFLFWNFFFGYLPIGFLVAILSFLGNIGFNLNDKMVYGFTGFIMYLIFIPLIALILASISWVFLSIGNFIKGVIIIPIVTRRH